MALSLITALSSLFVALFAIRKEALWRKNKPGDVHLGWIALYAIALCVYLDAAKNAMQPLDQSNIAKIGIGIAFFAVMSFVIRNRT
jgi:hypothetical protein